MSKGRPGQLALLAALLALATFFAGPARAQDAAPPAAPDAAAAAPAPAPDAAADPVSPNSAAAGSAAPEAEAAATPAPAAQIVPGPQLIAGPTADGPAAEEQAKPARVYNLYDYFGVIGLIAIATWALTLGLLAVYCFVLPRWAFAAAMTVLAAVLGALAAMHLQFAAVAAGGVILGVILGALVRLLRRPAAHLTYLAFVVALAALPLARISSDAVSAIQPDMRLEQEEQARARQKAMEAELEQRKAQVKLQFAEDAGSDRLDLAGVESDEDKSRYELAAEHASMPEWKRKLGGKQQREGDRSRGLEITQEIREETQQEAEQFKLLPGQDMYRANQLDRVSLFFTRLCLWLTLAVLVFEYLSRFNDSFARLLPLPIAGRWLDNYFPKTRCVRLPGQGESLRWYLEHAVCKGESFILLGQVDPWSEQALPRLRVGSFAGLPVPKINYQGDGDAGAAEFALEGAWFGRTCLVAPAPAAAGNLVPQLLEFLRLRQQTRATARRTVHLAIAADQPLDHDTLQELAFLGKQTNFKLVLAGPDHALPVGADFFDEIHAQDVPRHTSTLLTRYVAGPMLQALSSAIHWIISLRLPELAALGAAAVVRDVPELLNGLDEKARALLVGKSLARAAATTAKQDKITEKGKAGATSGSASKLTPVKPAGKLGLKPGSLSAAMASKTTAPAPGASAGSGGAANDLAALVGAFAAPASAAPAAPPVSAPAPAPGAAAAAPAGAPTHRVVKKIVKKVVRRVAQPGEGQTSATPGAPVMPAAATPTTSSPAAAAAAQPAVPAAPAVSVAPVAPVSSAPVAPPAPAAVTPAGSTPAAADAIAAIAATAAPAAPAIPTTPPAAPAAAVAEPAISAAAAAPAPAAPAVAPVPAAAPAPPAPALPASAAAPAVVPPGEPASGAPLLPGQRRVVKVIKKVVRRPVNATDQPAAPVAANPAAPPAATTPAPAPAAAIVPPATPAPALAPPPAPVAAAPAPAFAVPPAPPAPAAAPPAPVAAVPAPAPAAPAPVTTTPAQPGQHPPGTVVRKVVKKVVRRVVPPGTPGAISASATPGAATAPASPPAAAPRPAAPASAAPAATRSPAPPAQPPAPARAAALPTPPAPAPVRPAAAPPAPPVRSAPPAGDGLDALSALAAAASGGPSAPADDPANSLANLATGESNAPQAGDEAPANQQGDLLVFRCSTCAAKLGSKRGSEGKKIRCPHCSTVVVIPHIDPGGLIRTAAPATPATPKPQPAAKPGGVTVMRCPHCNTKLGIKSSMAGKQIECPKCLGPVRVPIGFSS